jgi:hypothetical protein
VVQRAQLPLLFLDVDGPLIPFGANAAPVALNTSTSGEGNANPLISRLDPLHGPWLTALPCDLVWATSWMADAVSGIALENPHPCRLGRGTRIRMG